MILAFDEMSIKSNLTYNSRVDKVIGYEDFGDIRTNNISTYVTVFMIKSLLVNWKQPVGFFYTSRLMTAEVIKSKVIICIEKLKKHLIKSFRNALYNKGFGNIHFKFIKYINITWKKHQQ